MRALQGVRKVQQRKIIQKVQQTLALLIIILLNVSFINAQEISGENDENDTTPPQLSVELPGIIAGSMLSVNGTTETGAEVTLFVNNVLRAGTVVQENDSFIFSNVELERNILNKIRIEAKDGANNKASFEKDVISDTIRPVLTLEETPDYVSENFLQVKGTISEQSHFEIFVNNESLKQGDGRQFDERISLKEGKNRIKVTIIDAAGLESSEEFDVESDTSQPTVQAEIEKGREYFEGRAVSSIHGKTKPGAKAYLYVYYPLGYSFKPDFKKAREVVTANENGEFTFEDVRFVSSISDVQLEDLSPRQVPSGLEDVSIFPIEQERAKQQSTYHVYIIVEDKKGRTAYWQATVAVNSCFSENLDFTVESVAKFQAPLRLVPNLLDEGRQEIQAVFNFKYQGEGIPSNEQDSGSAGEHGFRITSVQIDKACTQSMLKDKESQLACKILPRAPKKIESPDKTSIYATWNLLRSDEVSKRDDDFWNDLKKRQVVFPLKITINYEEREAGDKFSTPKTQTACFDLGYAVDIPLESKELIPDFLANEGVDALNFTITQLQTVRPYVEKAYLVSGIGCMGSFVLRTVVRWSRIFTSKVESYYGVVKPLLEAKKEGKTEDVSKGCPVDQSGLYMRSTLDNWKELYDAAENKDGLKLPEKVIEAFSSEEKMNAITLEEVCPHTASAWKLESALDTAYKWTCDRAFCRAVPAGWTAEADTDEIGSVILKQQQCAVTGRGIGLIKVENCQNLIDTNIVGQPQVRESVRNGICYRDQNDDLYVPDPEKDREFSQQAKAGIYRLKPVINILSGVAPLKEELVVYQPKGSDSFIVGVDQSCSDVCKNPRKPNYRSDGCYTEKTAADGTVILMKDGQQLTGDKYSAGYTRDCFVNVNSPEPVFKQCVCIGQKQEVQKYVARTAVKKQGNVDEEWSYQQDQLFKESRSLEGTYYPETIYYSGRDVSGAFGADYLLDYINPEGEKQVHQVNPHSQLIGTFQSVCLSGILKNMRMLESILLGLRNCLVEAKSTGLQDAGMCKTLFTQHVCGLIYKGIAYLNSQCSPLNFDDVGKEGAFEDVGAIVSRGFKAIPEALESSISDLRSDYGNARLNEYFKGGMQGFAQSMCLAAFGYEFPLFSEEFLLDAAYSFPVKTSVVMAPKERELSTYNPAKQTAIFNYNLGGIILPGCRIRNWKVSLKCIGPEDLGRPGIDPTCGGKGCDCLNAQSAASPFEGEKTKLLASGFDLTSGQMFNLPLPSPQKIDSHYRYDHVKVELILDPSEKGNVNECFDEGYIAGDSGAVFYEPIIDVSPPGELACSVDLVSGRYACPEFGSIFGFGGANFEEPYVTCWNERTKTWMDCRAPNVFLLNDEIKVRVHANMDEKGKCLRRTARNVPGIVEEVTRPLPENLPGLQYIPETLGIVRQDMFGGVSNTLLKTRESNANCNYGIIKVPEEVQSGQLFRFTLISADGGKAELVVEGSSIIPEAGYRVVNGRLQKDDGQMQFDTAEINSVKFNLGGFEVNNILGDVKITDENKLCSYQSVTQSRFAQSTNARDIQVQYQLLERDEAGSCLYASQQVKAPSGLRASITKPIRIQREATSLAEGSGLHALFASGNYGQVLITSNQIIVQQKGDLENALAIYYSIASILKRGEKERNIQRYVPQINNLLATFFERKSNGATADPYAAEVVNSGEYQKIKTYLCVIDQEFSQRYQQNECQSTAS